MKQKTKFKQTEIGMIPEEWEVVKLDDGKICKKIKAGGTPLRTIKKYYENGTIPFVRIEDMTKSRKYLDDTELKITELGLKNSSTWLAPENSILFSMYASYGEVIINKMPVATNQAIIAMIPQDPSDIEYFYYALSNLKTKLYKYLRETTQKNLNAEIVTNLLIPFPPPIERQKIASLLSTVDESIQKTDEIIRKSQELKRGLMQQLLTRGIGHTKFKQTEIGEIPEEWKVEKLEDVYISGTGGTPSRKKPEYFKGEIPWVKSTEIDFGVITSTAEKISRKALEESSAKLYPKGTLLVALYGQGVTRGKCALLGIGAAINQACAAFQSKGKIQLHFAFFWLQANYTKVRALSQGSNQANLNLGLVRSIKLPLPPLPEQQKIVSILSAVDEKIEKERQRKEQLEKLKKGLMQDLLTGRVRVKT